MNQPGSNRRAFLQGVGGVALAGLGIGAVSGCTKIGEGHALQKAKDSGTIRVGIANERPFGFMAGSEVTGEAPELARAVFKKMGINDIDAKTVQFGELVGMLVNETFDVVAAGMFINAERCERILFSDPDYAMPTVFLIKKGSPAQGMNNYADFKKNPEAKLGTMGKIAEYQAAVGQGVPTDQINPGFENQADAVNALLGGQFDALALTRVSLQTVLEEDPAIKKRVELGKPFFPMVDGRPWIQGGGFGFRRNDKDLRDAFNVELRKMHDNDEIFPIVSKFGFTRQEVEDAKRTTAAQLCRISGDNGKPVEKGA